MEIVKDFYTSQVQREWRRLVRDPYHRLEFDTTLHFLRKYLPPSGYLLDAGGGPGRYTVSLAEQGYEMTLLDLTAANLAFARRAVRRCGFVNKVKQIVEGTIVDLTRFPDGSFDGVICLGGPLSHILDAGERMRAASELLRVAKVGAPIFISVMGRLSLLTVELVSFPHEMEMAHFAEIRDTGDYFGGSGFTACHFFMPDEFRELFSLPGAQVLEMAGLEGLASFRRRSLNAVARNPGRWQIWWQTHLITCTHPAVVATSEHMLLALRKCAAA